MPYVLIDAVGIKEAFKQKQEKAIDMCQNLWELAKNMALYENRDIKWVTFSDSVLINWEEGVLPNGQPLMDWIKSILSKFEEKINTRLCAIANQGFEAKPSLVHDILPVTINSQHEPNYIHIAGLGDDFANLYFAEKEIAHLLKSNTISIKANIYLHSSLLTHNLLSGQNHFTVQGLAGHNETFYYF